ncbi:hypothetical protein NQ317_014886 [Molorchus minor]|uniref:Uracil-DNA glycosylase-like domain-containing protein n=1 Tax=Molorchus minor TaxID=1323400 RepID=A0ABQ9JD26_9CUCU|nr:hypothetical protein NQ317_014886 [Molorchus minor]
MCQTGVPFGDPKWVRNWLKVEAEVGKPQIECPDRRISGFSSEKSEYSFVANYCPLAFMKHDGGNITPGEIKNIQDRNALESVCEEAYLALIELLEPEIIIAIGRYMETKTKNLLQRNNIQRRVLYMPHPSPRVVNHHKWPEKVTEFLQENNLLPFFTRE